MHRRWGECRAIAPSMIQSGSIVVSLASVVPAGTNEPGASGRMEVLRQAADLPRGHMLFVPFPGTRIEAAMVAAILVVTACMGREALTGCVREIRFPGIQAHRPRAACGVGLGRIGPTRFCPP
jgi:hypothetical protein